MNLFLVILIFFVALDIYFRISQLKSIALVTELKVAAIVKILEKSGTPPLDVEGILKSLLGDLPVKQYEAYRKALIRSGVDPRTID